MGSRGGWASRGEQELDWRNYISIARYRWSSAPGQKSKRFFLVMTEKVQVAGLHLGRIWMRCVRIGRSTCRVRRAGSSSCGETIGLVVPCDDILPGLSLGLLVSFSVLPVSFHVLRASLFIWRRQQELMTWCWTWDMSD